MIVQDTLDLGGIDVLAAGDDHVVPAVEQFETTVLQKHADIAALLIVSGPRLFCRLRVVQIMREMNGRARRHFTDRAGRAQPSLIIEDDHFRAERRPHLRSQKTNLAPGRDPPDTRFRRPGPRAIDAGKVAGQSSVHHGY